MSNDQQHYAQGGQVPPQPPQGAQPFGRPPKKRHTARNVLLAIVGVFVLIIVAAVLSDGQQPASSSKPDAVVSTVDTGPSPEPMITPTNKPSAVKPSASQSAARKPAMTASQEQAVGSAEDYLRVQGFSRKGLIEQLKFEGFSTADATYGADHVAANWNEQAVKAAKAYLQLQHFSRSGLIDQLVFEGFTRKQAAFGVSKAGL